MSVSSPARSWRQRAVVGGRRPLDRFARPQHAFGGGPQRLHDAGDVVADQPRAIAELDLRRPQRRLRLRQPALGRVVAERDLERDRGRDERLPAAAQPAPVAPRRVVAVGLVELRRRVQLAEDRVALVGQEAEVLALVGLREAAAEVEVVDAAGVVAGAAASSADARRACPAPADRAATPSPRRSAAPPSADRRARRRTDRPRPALRQGAASTPMASARLMRASTSSACAPATDDSTKAARAWARKPSTRAASPPRTR